MTIEPTIAQLTDDQLIDNAVTDSIQDVYHVFRDVIQDHKLDAHRWEWRYTRHPAFLEWLQALAARVQKEIDDRAQQSALSTVPND